MVLMGSDIPLLAVRQQIASGIDLMVHLGRLRDKSRRVLEVSEVLGMKEGEIRIQKLYVFCERGEERGSITGGWERKNELCRRGKLEQRGLCLPSRES
jgi:pilus assembly protein CpaF